MHPVKLGFPVQCGQAVADAASARLCAVSAAVSRRRAAQRGQRAGRAFGFGMAGQHDAVPAPAHDQRRRSQLGGGRAACHSAPVSKRANQ